MKYEIFSLRLKQLRLSNNLTLLQLGNNVGSTKATISNLENGNKKPSLELILTLAEYFNVSLDYLTGRSDSSNITTVNDDNKNLTKKEIELLQYFKLLNKYEKNLIIGKMSEMIYNKNVDDNQVELSKELVNIELKDKLNN
ncbi:helix-turn-helix domain-containing protein [Sedimentibacter sp. MB31-C6]|uniref:helix-turn-helix domain-containing protein n=1 Tax=Sedimentibacter sp. MB31-C6 TaxID=3109366 RepID=UPI002DDD05C0|nr:helix-turn-helix transcriptional regulator [Sedimentibacter sp. MB36-C1]WSI05096.1 helix-turn-helix transcriptional regulator [Sedimentibacter sp. MB36-C1]